MAGLISLINTLHQIMNIGAGETFDQTTDSLEAIAAALGIGPGVGLWMFGIVDATQVASTTVITVNNLQNVPNDVLEGQFWMQVIYNTSAPATAPEGEFRQITNFVQGGALQTFTVDAFTANIEAGDYVCIFHESLLPQQIIAQGTLDTSSATVPADSTRTEVADYFNGMIFMATEGATRFQPRRIVDYSAAGVFTLDPNNPLTGVPGLVDYVIVNSQTEFVPAADAVINRTPADVIGGKTDTAMYDAATVVSSIVRLLKGLMGAKILYTGVADPGSNTLVCVDAAVFTEVDAYYRGLTLIMLTGVNTGQARPITNSDQGSTSVEIDPDHPFTNAIAAGNVYVVVSDYHEVVPVADAANNLLPSHVIGSKQDTAVYAPDNVSSAMRYLKGMLTSIGQIGHPEMQYYEGWQDELGIDFTLWTLTHPATGTAWSRGAGTGVMVGGLRAMAAPNANETARLISTFRFPISPDLWGTNSILKLLNWEFEMTLTNLANIDNTLTFFGLIPAVANTRASPNIIGFCLLADVLCTLTDLATVETVNTAFGEDLTVKNKFRITVRQTAAAVGTVDFYLNEVLIASHITNLPDMPMYFNWFIDTEGGGDCTPQIGINRAWTEDFQRP